MNPAKLATSLLTPQQEDFIEIESQCCLCGTPLVFVHESVLETAAIKEKAHCPCCKVQLKEKEFTIH